MFKMSSRINSTWGGNLVDMVRGARYLEIIDEENLIENARVVGEHLRRGCASWPRSSPAVMSNVRGRGLFLAFDLPDKAMRDRTLAACLENGLIALASGVSAIRFRPHLTLTKDEADEGVGSCAARWRPRKRSFARAAESAVETRSDRPVVSGAGSRLRTAE